MLSLLKKEIELPRSGPAFIILAILVTVSTISSLVKDSRYFGYYLLGFSVLITICGIGIAFSKKDRERARARLTAEFPERAAQINAPDADKVTIRRGYYFMVFGIALFLIWCWFFGFSTLAAGV